jgi:hypothetical protein
LRFLYASPLKTAFFFFCTPYPSGKDTFSGWIEVLLLAVGDVMKALVDLIPLAVYSMLVLNCTTEASPARVIEGRCDWLSRPRDMRSPRIMEATRTYLAVSFELLCSVCVLSYGSNDATLGCPPPLTLIELRRLPFLLLAMSLVYSSKFSFCAFRSSNVASVSVCSSLNNF